MYGVYVPVTDFYSSESNINVGSVDELFTNCLDCTYKMIDINELDFSQKLLRINNEYYLDTFKSGAVFRIMKFDSLNYIDEIEPLVVESFYTLFPNESSVMTFAQTGVTAFSRLMNAKMDEVDSGAYFAEGLAEYLSKYDYTHTSNEASFSDWAPTSGATGTPICSDMRFIDTFKAIGLDIVELTGNHNLDCGIDAANDSIDIYDDNKIMIVGGGKDADSASEPLDFRKKDTEITMLAFTDVIKNGSYVIYTEEAKDILSAGYKKADFKQMTYIDGLASRKKQMVPVILSELE